MIKLVAPILHCWHGAALVGSKAPALGHPCQARRARWKIMRHSPSRSFTFALASIALIGPLAVHLFMPVIPAVKAGLGLSDAHAQLTFTIALFGMAFSTLAYGSLSDRYGRRPVLLSGLCFFLLGSIISAAADRGAILVIGRLVQAIGAGCGMTLVRTIARDVYGPERLVRAIAYLTMFYTLGPMIAPVVSGVLVDTFGWRSVFGFAVLTGGAITMAAYMAIYETRPAADAGQSSGNVFRNYLRLFSHLRFSAFVLQTGFSTGAFITLASASSSLMKELLDRSSTEFGFYFLAFPAGYFLGNLISSRVGSRGPTEAMVLTGSILSMAAVAIQAALLLSGHVTPLVIFLPGFFLTMGQGIALPYGQTAVIATIPKLAGTAAGIGVFVQNFCGAFFAQLYGLIANGTAEPMVLMTMLASSLCLVAGALPFLLLWQRRH
jgi:DHA1 family bicyclomycin/chloramphenicol resistance-like MFS transporter